MKRNEWTRETRETRERGTILVDLVFNKEVSYELSTKLGTDYGYLYVYGCQVGALVLLVDSRG